MSNIPKLHSIYYSKSLVLSRGNPQYLRSDVYLSMSMSNSLDYKAIGKRIRSAREHLGITQTDLGDSLDISQSAVARIESGDSRLTLGNLAKLQDILHQPITYFLGIKTELAAEEEEVLSIFRSILPGPIRDAAIKFLHSLAQHAKDFITIRPVPTIRQESVPYRVKSSDSDTGPQNVDVEDVMDILQNLDTLELQLIYDFCLWRYGEQSRRRDSYGRRAGQQNTFEDLLPLMKRLSSGERASIVQTIRQLEQIAQEREERECDPEADQ